MTGVFKCLEGITKTNLQGQEKDLAGFHKKTSQVSETCEV